MLHFGDNNIVILQKKNQVVQDFCPSDIQQMRIYGPPRTASTLNGIFSQRAQVATG